MKVSYTAPIRTSVGRKKILFFSYQDSAATTMQGGSHRPRIKIKISLTLSSQPTFAHTFLSTPGDVQPDKKKSVGVSADFISPATSEHPCQASTVT